MLDQTGKPLPSGDAWRMFDKWKLGRKEIGVIFYGKSGTLCTLGVLSAARDGRIEVSGTNAGASFNLKSADFLYGPVLMFPRWPAPPPVEVMAIQACLSNGDWLVLAEGLKPEMLPALRSLSS